MDQVGLFATNGSFDYEDILWTGNMYLLPGDSVQGPVNLPIPGNAPLGIYTLSISVYYAGVANGETSLDVEVLP